MATNNDSSSSSLGTSTDPSHQTSSSSEPTPQSSSNPNTSSSEPTPQSSGSASQSLPSTKPVEEEDYQEEIANQNQMPWGQLNPVNPDKYSAFNLSGEGEIKFGRIPNHHYVFVKEYLTPQEYMNISKTHFTISKQGDGSIQIRDLSSNGTFVNRTLIGKNNTYPLTHLCVIGMGLSNHDVFTFINLAEKKKEEEKMPAEFKEKYILEHMILGEGRQGCVKKCFLREQPDRKFAVKVITKGRSLDSHITDFSYEASILSSVEHQYIVKIFDCFENEHYLYMVMEFVRGGELFDFVKNKGPVDEKRAAKFFRQLLEGVAYLHAKGITHRDLKPENILLDDKDYPSILKVTDFGLSRFVSDTSLMESLVGTHSYLAPEILSPSKRMKGYTKKVDSWSLGCILFILLGGYPPFSSEDPDHDLDTLIMRGLFTFHEERWSHISENAKELVKLLLTVKEEDRLSVSEALEHPFIMESREPPAKRRKSS